MTTPEQTKQPETNNTRQDIIQLIDDIRENWSLIDSIRPSEFESLVAEVLGQHQKLIQVERNALRGVDYIAQFQDELGRARSIAIEAKNRRAGIGQEVIQRLSESANALNLDKSYLVTTSPITEGALRLAAQLKDSVEIINRASLKEMLNQYERNRYTLSQALFEQLDALRLRDVLSIPEPTAEQIDRIEPLASDLSEPQRNALITVDAVPLKLISRILRAPEEIHSLSPRQFEEFIAETLSQLGFKNVTLTPRSRDGGKDVIASHVVNGIPLSFYFECKKYSQNNKVELETLRTLLGTIAHDARGVNKGVLVTTSTFTAGAKEFILSESRLDGKDYDDILGWVEELRSRI